MRSKYPPRHYRYPLFWRYTCTQVHGHRTFNDLLAKKCETLGAVCRSRNSSINNPGPSPAERPRWHSWCTPVGASRCKTRAHAHPLLLLSVEKARKPASPRSHARDGLSDLHARQVRRASESVYYVFNSRVSHTRRVTIPADFHNATRAPERFRAGGFRPRDRRPYFSARQIAGCVYACPYRSRLTRVGRCQPRINRRLKKKSGWIN